MDEKIVSRNPNKYYNKISVKDNAAILREFNDFGEDEKPIRFCPHCGENGIHNPLGPRLDYTERDKDEWLECNRPNRGCGKIYPRYQSKVESNVTDFIEPSTNPFDSGHAKIIGNENKRFKKSDTEKQRERQLKELNSIDDEDERRDRRKVGFVEYDSY